MAQLKRKYPLVNQRNIYAIRNGGWYLNMRFGGQTYREAFTAHRYGSSAEALRRAVDLRELLEGFRDQITLYVEGVTNFPHYEWAYATQLRARVRMAITGQGQPQVSA